MAESNAELGFGADLQIGDGGGPEVFTSIAEVKDISGPSLSRDTPEVTHHQSPGQFEEVIAGIARSGEVTFELNFLPTEATHRDAAGGLLNDFKNGTKRNFKLVFPETTEWDFTGFVTGFEPSMPVADPLTASVTLKLTGLPTFA